MIRRKQPAQPDAPQKSAREQFDGLGAFQDAQNEKIRQKLRDDMSENLTRIALWLPKMLDDEMALRKRRRCLDDSKLKEFYFGGWPLERISSLRIGVNVFQVILSPYGKAEVEAMDGFTDLVKACAAKNVDMKIHIVRNPGWASDMVEIVFDRPFDHKGPYKDLVAPPKPKVPKLRP